MRKLDSDDFPSARVMWVPLGLMVLAMLLRLLKSSGVGVDWLPNISPWMALAITGTALFARALPWWLVLAAMACVDLITQGGVILANASSMGVVYGCFTAAALWGRQMKGQASGATLISATVLCSLGFYLVTNTVAWMASPDYARSMSGWLQALTIGLPGFPPTWVFLRNSLLSDMGFSYVLLVAYNAEARLRQLTPLRWMAVLN